MGLKIVHVVPHICEEAAGPSYSVPRLAQSEAELGNEVELTCLAACDVPGVRLDVHPQWPIANHFAISHRHALELRRKAAQVDIVHNHSLWSMVNVACGFVVPGRRARLVVSPRGTLSPWALSRSRFVKKLLWPLQRRALKRADLLHATSENEYADIRRLGFKAPVAIIPNGIDIPKFINTDKPSTRRTLLFLSRLHPKKGIELLFAVWAKLEPKHRDWSLRIVGKGEPKYEQSLRHLARDMGLSRVDFDGPLYGATKSLAYFDAELFVLPTHSENFGMVVAEALAHGCPAVVSHGAPWAGLETEGCGWWVSLDVATLTRVLDEAMQLRKDQLAAKGKVGREWMQRNYGWHSVAERMDEAYRWVIYGGRCPEWIRQG